MTKAQQIYDTVEAKIASGTPKAAAFKQLADELGLTVGGVRGAYYSFSKAQNGGPGRTRRRATTEEAAVADAKRVLERAIQQVDAEVDAAAERAAEAKAEHEALKESAPARKQAIQARLESLA